MSPFALSFLNRIFYDHHPAITFSIFLSSDSQTFVPVKVKLDTGSTFCVLQRQYAEALGIEVEKGAQERVRAATGSFLAYGHEIMISLEGIEWQAMVFFAEDEFFPVNVVGRVGFLDRLRIGLVDYEQTLYLSAYDD
ncbi:MAG TPA: aspartyl protease family protein [Blastocatellia bacterium]|nr:aspartyl protease family protein [Blastocatellia bacterium]